MSSTTKSPPVGLPGMGAFCVGIAFIAAATVLNVAHDRLSGFRFETLPLFGVANRMNAYNTYLLMEHQAR